MPATSDFELVYRFENLAYLVGALLFILALAGLSKQTKARRGNLFGMFGMVFHMRIYFSILMNAFAYIFMFSALKYLLSQQKIEIDCYGDKARVNQYKSTFFD